MLPEGFRGELRTYVLFDAVEAARSAGCRDARWLEETKNRQKTK
jgi:hypothetical protein